MVATRRERQPNELLRRARGQISQATLADLVNAEIYRATRQVTTLTAKSISDWERGWYSWPRADVRVALCKALGVADPAELGFEKRRRASSELPGAGGVVTPLLEFASNGRGAEASTTGLLSVAGGRTFFGAELAIHHCVAEDTGREWVATETTDEAIGELSRPDHRSMLVAADTRGGEQRAVSRSLPLV